MAFGGKTDAKRRIGLRRDLGENVWIGAQLKTHRRARFLDFVIEILCRAIVGHRCHRNEHIRAGQRRENRVAHGKGACRFNAPHPGGHRQSDRPAHQRYLGAGTGAGRCEGIAHLARTGVRDTAHRVNRLKRRPGRQHQLASGQQSGREKSAQRIAQGIGCPHAPRPGFAARLFPLVRVENNDTIARKRREIALSGRVLPHLAIHRRGDQQRTVTRQAQRREQIIGQPAGNTRNEPGACRRNNNGVHPAPERDMRHSPFRAPRAIFPQRCPDPIPGQSVERQGRHKTRARLSHHHMNLRPHAPERAREFGGLVRSDTAGHAQNNSAPMQTVDDIAIIRHHFLT